MVCNRKFLDVQDLAVATLGEAITAARMKAGLSDQDLAYAQGILPSLWSRQIHGQGHIALDRLAHTPLAFRVELIAQLERFPITPMTSPISAIGLDGKYRWARRDVEQFLDGGFRSLHPRHVRLRLSA